MSEKADKILTRLIDSGKGWESLSSNEWVDLLSYDSEYAPKCDAVKGWERFNGYDWVKLLKNNPRLAEKCGEYNGEKKFTIWDTIELLKIHPYLVNICPIMHDTDAKAWICILDELPQFLEKCDEVGGFKEFGIKSWDWQDYYNEQINCWSYLLIKHPEWADRCDKFKGWVDFQAKDWVALLKKHPCFADRCNTADGWKSFKNHNWVNLLQQQPQFAVQCGSYNCWQNFNGFDWVELLRERPEFVGKCNQFDGWMKIDFASINVSNNSSIEVVHGRIIDENGNKNQIKAIKYQYGASDDEGDCETIGYTLYGGNGEKLAEKKGTPLFCGRWAELLEKQPQFATKCDEYNGWEVFDGFDWWRVVWSQLGFVEKCNMYDGWGKIFRYEFSEEYNHNYDGYDESYDDEGPYVSPCFSFPKEYANTFSRQYGYGWYGDRLDMLARRRYTEVLKDGSVRTIKLQPRKELYEECVQKASNSFWICALLQNWPGQLTFDNRGVPTRSIANAFFCEFNKMDGWNKFTTEEWQRLLGKGFHRINRVASYVDSHFWDSLLSAWPDWRCKIENCEVCNDEEKFDAWPALLLYRMEFTALCNEQEGWNVFKKDDWIRLLDESVGFLAKMNISDLVSSFWFNLLKTAPQLVDRCDQYCGWVKLAGKQWFEILLLHPEFADRCDANDGWRYFDAYDWVKLAKMHPYLLDKCDKLSELEGIDWCHILMAEPSLAKFCDLCDGWSRFLKEDWLLLLYKHKDFAKKIESYGVLQKFGWKDTNDALRDAEAYSNRCHCCSDYADSCDEIPDWREESGWNDVYGADVDASDIIEFRD